MIWGSGGSKSRLAKAAGADHFWQLRCRKSARRCGAKHISSPVPGLPHKVKVDKLCEDKLCVDKLCDEKLCDEKLCVSKLCGQVVCVCGQAV